MYKISTTLGCTNTDCDSVYTDISYMSYDGPPPCPRCGGKLAYRRLNRFNTSSVQDIVQSHTAPGTSGLATITLGNGQKIDQATYQAKIDRWTATHPGHEVHTVSASETDVRTEADELRHNEFRRQRQLGIDEVTKKAAREIHDSRVAAAEAEAIRTNADPAAAVREAKKAAPTPAALAAGAVS